MPRVYAKPSHCPGGWVVDSTLPVAPLAYFIGQRCHMFGESAPLLSSSHSMYPFWSFERDSLDKCTSFRNKGLRDFASFRGVQGLLGPGAPPRRVLFLKELLSKNTLFGLFLLKTNFSCLPRGRGKPGVPLVYILSVPTSTKISYSSAPCVFVFKIRAYPTLPRSITHYSTCRPFLRSLHNNHEVPSFI